MADLPAHLQGLAPRGLTQRLLANIGAGTPPYISIMGNSFTLIDAVGNEEKVTTHDPKLGVYLDCCIIDGGDHESKIYYSKPYDPNANTYAPPDCWSDNGVAPSRNCSVPQARTCMPDPTGVNGCKHAVWGSATSKVSGKGVPACGKYQKLALALPGDDMAFLMRVPPNSLSNLQLYLAKFAGQNVGPEHVITRISFEPGMVGTLIFQAVSYIDAAMVSLQNKLLSEKATDMLVGRGDQPIHIASGAIAGVIADNRAAPELPLSQTQVNQQPQQTPTPTVTAPAAPEPTRRRRRTAAAETQTSAPTNGPAPFTQHQPVPPEHAQAQGGPSGAAFGMAHGQAPGAELNKELDGLFGPAAGR